MKIKVKLTLGVGLLFMFILVLATLGITYINAINKDTQNILVANYNTLDYSREMLIALDDDIRSTNSIERFESNLIKQQNNITEIGEKELTDKLSHDFTLLKSNPKEAKLAIIIRKDLADIMLINMLAIQRKSNIAKLTASNAQLWISVSGVLCFLIAFVLLVNLPGNIADPIKELTLSIKQIANKNYEQRVHFEGHSEFGELAKSFNSMAEKLEEYNNSNLSKILFQKKRIETLINNMKDPVLGLDENLLILFVNEEMVKIIGLPQKELVGKKATEVSIYNDLIRNLLREIIGEKEHEQNEKGEPLKIYANNKESYFDKNTLQITIKPTGEENIKLIGHVIILRNITEYKELDTAKTNFIATVSHEFKTPISAIKMSIQLLEKEQIGSLNSEQKNLLDSISDDANRLLRITGELLDLTQVESGNIQLSIMPVDALEMLQYAINANKTQAEQKHIVIKQQIENNLPLVLADNEKTAWVLTNLLSNAIRYSYVDSVIVIGIKSINGKIEFAVTDNGEGIAAQYKLKIFDRYFRIPGSNKEGTGLGLAISKEFIEAQGGQIELESEVGIGSTFTIKLNAVS